LVAAWLAHANITSLPACATALRKTTSNGWQVCDAAGHVIAQAPQLVIAAAMGSNALLESVSISLRLAPVDGQVAWGVWPSAPSPSPTLDQQAINGNGHFIPAVSAGSDHDGTPFWLSGSTYERQEFSSAQERQAYGLQANRERLQQLLPQELLPLIEQQFEQGQVQHWQGNRCTTSDRLPVVGSVAPGLYVCTGMGSRGLSFSALCAEMLVEEMHGQKSAHAQLLSPQRNCVLG
jgi:tRNA 5-methylaminomethyl-2-thiouridine biosynthesis bifunctional protein